MPTTCGFPNCKFRSRYRGADDNRHFYRVPKKPPVLRNKWLEAIGRTEQTIVSQLRVCSGHFHGGEKREGDVPVSDPMEDAPIKVDLPPKTPRVSSSCRRNRRLKALLHGHTGGLHKAAAHINTSLSAPMVERTSPGGPCSSGSSAGSTPSLPAFMTELLKSPLAPPPPPSALPFHLKNELSSCPLLPHALGMRPLVALLDGRDCTVELPVLKDVALVAFCDATTSDELHEKVLKEATGVLLWRGMKLQWEDLRKFRNLKVIIKMGAGHDNIDVRAAGEMGIAVSVISASCVEEVADSTLCMILGLYRRVFTLSSALISGKLSNDSSLDAVWQMLHGCPRIRGQTLGLVGLDQVGVAVAVRAKVFGFHVVAFDPTGVQGRERSLGIERVDSLAEVLRRADCISLHCPSGMDSHHIINEATLRHVKHGAFIVNTSESGLIHEAALASALKSGLVAAAAIDCFEMDPFNSTESALKDAPNLICTPNVSYFSDQCVTELREKAASEMRRALLGKLPDSLNNCVNKHFIVPQRPHIKHPNLFANGFPQGLSDQSIFSINSLVRGYH